MLEVFTLPVTEGLELTTRILYPEPVAVFDGIVAAIVPEEVELKVPMFIGLAKLPFPLESWAVKIFPAFAAALVVKGTLTGNPAQ